MTGQPVIHWFRRDLRLQDNTALNAAIQSGRPVLPLFIFDEQLLASERVGAARLQFLLDALQALADELKRHNGQLVIRRGNPLVVLQQLIMDTGADAIYLNEDYTPYARIRDTALAAQTGVNVHPYEDVLLIAPGDVLKDEGTPYVVYTPFWKQWKTKPKASMTHDVLQDAHFYAPEELDAGQLPDLAALGCPEKVTLFAGTSPTVGQQLLQAFLDHDIVHYDERRNWLPINPFAENRPSGSSYLSAYLRLGLLSIRQVYWAARDAHSNTKNTTYQDSIEKYVGELAWREFYTHILFHFPHVLKRDFVDTYQTLAWRDAPDNLQLWKDGMTGYPIIDAPMRQLKTIGWMPNRARMIVASFLTKDLLIHWKHGDVHFMQHLLDGDPAANNGGWQWAAGTGTDAQPYFRIFNPVAQSKKFADPGYLRHWIPELQGVPDQHIHEPWLMKKQTPDYPPPMVDHALARERTLNAFKLARGS